ncbi:MAG: NADH-quinone oxidoreductase subunit J [Candidatus Hydrogenedentota bacterium]
MTISITILLTVLLIVSAGFVVLSKNVARSAFFLLFTFSCVACFYSILGCNFLACVWVMIYVGGILVLIIFGVIITYTIQNIGFTQKQNLVPGIIISVCMFIVFLKLISSSAWPKLNITSQEVNQIADTLLGPYMLPFEAVSILLLICMIGAATIARRRLE